MRPALGRLGSLAVVLLAAARTVFAGAAAPVPVESGRDTALTTIARLGGTWRADSALAGAPIVRIDLHASAVADSDLADFAGLGHLRHLDLRLTSVGDSGVARLAGLRRLVFVNLFRTRVGDRGLAALFQSAGIETLLVGGTKLTDQGLQGLSALPDLRRLSLFETAVGDSGLAQLAGLEHLETVLTTRSKVTPEGQAALRAIRPKVRFSED